MARKSRKSTKLEINQHEKQNTISPSVMVQQLATAAYARISVDKKNGWMYPDTNYNASSVY